MPILPDYLYAIEHESTSPASSKKINEGPPDQPLGYEDDENATALIEATSRRTFVAADLLNENSRIGLLFSSKAFVQLFVNPCVGIVAER